MLRKYAGKLPFEIEKIEIEKTWRELFSGRISRLRLVLRKDQVRVELAGPLDLKLSSDPGKKFGFDAKYLPAVQAEIEKNAENKLRLPTFPLHLWAKREGELGAEIETQEWNWEAVGLSLSQPKIRLNWKDNSLQTQIQAQSVSWSSKKDGIERTLQLQSPAFRAQAETDLSRSMPLGSIEATLQGVGAEILWGESYFDLPWKDLPLRIAGDLQKSALSAQIGPKQNSPALLQLDVRLLNDQKGADLSWETSSWPIQDLLKKLNQVSPGILPQNLVQLRIPKGTLHASGKARWIQQTKKSESALQIQKTRMNIGPLDLKLPGDLASVRGAKLDLALQPSGREEWSLEAGLSAEHLGFRRFRGKLGPTPIRAKGNPSLLEIQIGDPSAPLPFSIESLPLKIGPLSGSLTPGNDSTPLDFELSTSLNLLPIPLKEILAPLCITPDSFPPATVQASFPGIDLTRESIDLDGKARADFFEGFVEAKDLGLFDFMSDVPEIDFSVIFDGIRLDRLGEWLRFGEMDGVLTGGARDVTFQSWLPTQYDVDIEVKPLRHRDVVFSPEAMKNFARAFAGETMDHLPGIVNWYFFGLPRKILGGYDVDSAGIHLKGADGFIHVTTVEKPDVFKKEGKHFILYSNRVKMPLNSARYPLIVDATAMGNYVRRMMVQFGSKNDRKEIENEPGTPCKPDP